MIGFLAGAVTGSAITALLAAYRIKVQTALMRRLLDDYASLTFPRTIAVQREDLSTLHTVSMN